MFGDKKIGVKEHDVRERKDRTILDFELMDSIKEKYKPQPPENLFGTPPIMSTPQPKSSNIDIDSLIKRIDKKIEQLEEEERKEKKED